MGLIGKSMFLASQTTRTAWFGAQYGLAQRLAPPIDGPLPKPGSLPGWPTILKDLRALRLQDWANIEAGYYPMPDDLIPDPRRAIGSALRFVKDLPAVNLRRRLRDWSDVPPAARPRYYMQNFHNQSGGWMTDDSAALYDHQVEVLFTGGADAMRRQALVPLGDWLRVNGAADRTLLDIGCGTARFLAEAKRAHPALSLIGLDPSAAYLTKARQGLRRWRKDFTPILGLAESLPFATGLGPDLIASVFVMHELPRKIRHKGLSEMARVLRPGGRLVIVDSIRLGDHADYDTLLDRFPIAFHEPYYQDYIRDDLERVGTECGLVHTGTSRAFFSRIMTFDKPV
ncbi:class I SAM-dependent methyltransferase [Rhodospirillaceae bacterium KN72]|uniref:Class I SAM-dependent methyltransferase n=1 Tax=Pacificispira spongiicola TaxID=2729598 RepID=A0A7Y0HE77_9PROT|nr:class I SAM-dependent methyltransferase [Pacificispira spongiicola]NMM43238.1 class I SAM-dependent methyltransferase [Pacificispira spongiicola]